MQNGYCMPTSEVNLALVTHYLDPVEQPDLRRKFMNAIQYGIQWDTQVIPSNGPPHSELYQCHKVAQIYCSALPVAYSRYKAESWKDFATAVLDAAYEATLAAGALLSQQRGGQRVNVFLTSVGGGAFGNPLEWINESIAKALEKFKGYPLDVIMVEFQSDQDYIKR